MKKYQWPPPLTLTYELIHHLSTWGFRAPWGMSNEPYSVWIGEVMSQQTTLPAVIPYYDRFLKDLPEVTHLAQASDEQLNQLWRGLGYPSRVFRLREAAQLIVKQGAFPQRYEDWLKLPGVGPYTAAAISAQCFHQPKGALDGNAIRVLTRLRTEAIPWWTSKGRKVLQQALDEWLQIVPPQEVGLLNQSLMILGSTICKNTHPRCSLCPLQSICCANKKNQTHLFPLSKPQKKQVLLAVTAQCYREHKGMILVTRLSQKSPILKNQWSLPLEFKTLLHKPKAKDFHFTHSITNHRLYVRIVSVSKPPHIQNKNQAYWQDETMFLHPEELNKISPFSFTEKLVQHLPI